MRALCFGIVIIMWANWAYSATYYIDSVTGNDRESGTSQGAPWRTIDRVNRASLNPGDTVLFRRGRLWRETLAPPASGTSNAPVTFGAYGAESQPPVISGADLLTGWTQHSGNIWRAACPNQTNVVAFNGSVGERKPDLASLAVARDWCWITGTLYIFSTVPPQAAFTNPGVEAATRDACIHSLGKSRVNYTGISLKFANRACFYADDDDHYLILTSMSAYGGGDAGGFRFDSSISPTLIRCRADWCRSAANSDGYSFQTACRNITMRDCRASYNRRRGAQFDTGISGFIRIYGGEFHHQFGVNQSDGIAIDKNDAILIEGAWCHDNGVNNDSADGIQISGDSHNPVIRYCRLERNYNGGLVLESDGGAIYYNISRLNRHGAAIRGNATRPLQIYNNTFYNNEYGIFFYDLSPVAPVRVMNNILYGSSDVRRAAYLASGLDDSKIMLTRNGFWGDDNSYMIEWGGRMYQRVQFNAFSTETGAMIDSICADPRFVNPVAGDFRLHTNSPMIAKGGAVGLMRDIVGNPVPATAPDLGAHQIIGTLPQGAKRSAGPAKWNYYQ